MSDTPDNTTVIAVLGAKMDEVQRTLNSVKEVSSKHDDRIRENEMQIAGLNLRFGWLTGILGSLQVITVSIAAWLGLKG